jgi:signal transduction histidine kinase
LGGEQIGRLNEEQKKALAVVGEETARLGKVINDILDLTKLKTGSIKIDKNIFDVKKMIKEQIKSFISSIREKNLDLKIDIPENIKIHASRSMLIKALDNLVHNAVKFTQNGGILIKVVKEPKEIVFQIKDTGMGISKEDLPKIFDPLFMKERAGTGSGVGLAITKKIIEKHGGRIWVQSSLGKGSIFYFTIPTES